MADEATLREQIENAKKDPAWEKVQQIIEKTPQIKFLFFTSQLTDLLLFTADMLHLTETAKESIVKDKMKGVPELVTDPRYFILDQLKSEEERRAWKEYLIAEMERRFREKTAQYNLWLLNQALVMFCTVMDAFLESTLDAVLRTNVKILYGAAGAKSIELKHMVDLGSLDAVIDEFRKKEIKNFSYEEIKERFDYIESKLGISKENVFEWRNQTKEIQDQLKGWDLNTLKEIYQKRHSIVHRGALPIMTLDELSKISSFFTHIVANLAFLVNKKHKVQSDVQLMISQIELYNIERLKSQ